MWNLDDTGWVGVCKLGILWSIDYLEVFEMVAILVGILDEH